MKLRNKLSGEIKEFTLFDGNELQGGVTLESLTREWEDVPKKYWTVDCGMAVDYIWNYDKYDRAAEAVGLKFDTREECRRAIEKLKAFKRLKDKGFRFVGWQHDVVNQKYIITMEEKDFEEWVVGSKKADLDLLFSGGEE